MASPPAAPPPPPPPALRSLKNLPPAAESSHGDTSSSSSSISLSPSLIIISAIIAFVFIASASIHLLLRFLSSRRRSSSVAAAPPLPLLLQLRRSDSSSPSSSAAAAAPAPASDSGLSQKEKESLIDSLPLFSLASSLATLPKSTPDCAVCLCPFRPHDVLRLLPACRHAFHSRCVDPWLRSAPSCPLCRTSIALPALPLPPPALASNGDPNRSGSFRVEIGSVSRRRTPADSEPAGNTPQHLRTYSLGSSFEYVVDEEVEAVVAQIRRRTEKEEKREAATAEPAASAIAAAPAAESGGGGGRGRLREYVDRLASSASSSFSSFRFSGGWSHRYDGGAVPRYSWDLEGSARREAEEGGYYSFYRWLIGV